MTLRKQIFICIVTLFIFAFIGTFALSVQNIKSFLVSQLATEAQNTASSLGISISQYKDVDKTTMSLLIDSVFKTGHYQSISIKFIEGEDDLVREQKSQLDNIPHWFTNLIPLEIPEGTALVMQGWKQLGTIYVASDNEQAYQQLWKNINALFWWFLGSAIVTFLLAVIALHYLLKPLEAIKIQAEAISNRDFSIQNSLPRTTELRAVVTVMNTLSKKIEDMFTKQTKVMEQLRTISYKDPETRIGNRRYFTMQLENLISSETERFHGALLLIAIAHLDQYKKNYGYEATDLYLKRFVEILSKLCTSNPRYISARLTDNNFALLSADVDAETAKKDAINLLEQFSALHVNLKQQTTQCYVGVAIYKTGLSVNEFLSEADMALQAAQAEEEGNWHILNPNELAKSNIQGAEKWKKHLEDVIQNKSINLYFQPVVNLHDKNNPIIHQEVLLRIPDPSGELVAAGVFIPMAENYGLVTAFDRIIIEKLQEKIKQHKDSNSRFAVNLSPGSLRDSNFINWLYKTLSENPQFAKRLTFEIPEHNAVHTLDILPEFVARLDKLGTHFALDHFGRGFSSFKYLRDIKIKYLKVDGSYIRNIDKDTSNQFFVHVITQLAHNLGITVIAANVETETELFTLEHLDFDGVQGYYVGKPSEGL